MWLVVGLGNPGSKYENNRHNAGFMAVDHLLKKLQATDISKRDFKGELYRSGELYLLKPATFMNQSGESVEAVKRYYKIENIIVLHDEIELPLGSIRYKKGGGNAGHNGLRSIDKHIGPDYYRARIGIGKPNTKDEIASYCLSDFTKKERELLSEVLECCSAAVLELVKGEELSKVCSRYTKKGIKSTPDEHGK